MTLYGSETWTLRKEDIKRLEAFEMWIWRRMEKISWTEKITNEEVWKRIEERKSLISTIRARQTKEMDIGYVLKEKSCLLRELLEKKR